LYKSYVDVLADLFYPHAWVSKNKKFRWF